MTFVAHVQYALTAAILGLMLVAPPPLRADPTPATDRQEQQGLRWPVQGKITSRFGPRGGGGDGGVQRAPVVVRASDQDRPPERAPHRVRPQQQQFREGGATRERGGGHRRRRADGPRHYQSSALRGAAPRCREGSAP